MAVLNLQEVEMLANLLQRAGVNQYEVLWANQVLARLREAAQPVLDTGGDDDDEPSIQPRG